jgi:hypothetical protein
MDETSNVHERGEKWESERIKIEACYVGEIGVSWWKIE